MAIVAISCTNDEVEVISSMPQDEFDTLIGEIEVNTIIGAFKPQSTEIEIAIYTRLTKSKQQIDSILNSHFGNSAHYTLDSVVMFYGPSPDKLIYSEEIRYYRDNSLTYDNEWHGISLKVEKEMDCYIQIEAYNTLDLKNCYYKNKKSYNFNENLRYNYGGWFVLSGKTQQIASKKIKEPEAIDLGLSVKWASCNLGGFISSDKGIMAVWGDPSGNVLEGTDYDSYGIKNAPDDISGTEYDIVKAMLGGNWRLPTAEEVQELKDNCEKETFREYDSALLRGLYVYTAPNGNSIEFLNDKDVYYMIGTSKYNYINIIDVYSFNPYLGRISTTTDANELFYIRPVLDE